MAAAGGGDAVTLACVVCGTTPALRCSRCKGSAAYCGRACQQADWRGGHKTFCMSIEQAMRAGDVALREAGAAAAASRHADAAWSYAGLVGLSLSHPRLGVNMLAFLALAVDHAAEAGLPPPWPLLERVTRGGADPVDGTAACLLGLKARVLCRSGRPAEALALLRSAQPALERVLSERSGRSDHIHALLAAHCLAELTASADAEAAIRLLRLAELPDRPLHLTSGPLRIAYVDARCLLAELLSATQPTEALAELRRLEQLALEMGSVLGVSGETRLAPAPTLRLHALLARLLLMAGQDDDAHRHYTLASSEWKLGGASPAIHEPALRAFAVTCARAGAYELADSVLSEIAAAPLDALEAQVRVHVAAGDYDAARLTAREQDPYRRRSQRHCGGPGCARHLRPDGGPLDYCEGCRVTHYCSPACQKADWKPRHKAECAALRGEREAREAAETREVAKVWAGTGRPGAA